MMTFKIDVPQTLQDITARIGCKGGRVNLVGGAVRDALAGAPVKDWDCEVFNLDADSLISLLSEFGKVDTVGRTFGVIKLWAGGIDFDFTLPRRDNKQGQGHRGFVVEVDPTMTAEEAASRRDFTINSGAFDLTTRTLIDPFGAQQDIENGTLKATSDKFDEDGTIRTLRGFQFAARLRLTVDSGTAGRCAAAADGLTHEAHERIWAEFEKWAVKGSKLSMGIDFLVTCGWHRSAFPVLGLMKDTKQDKTFHPEGDVLAHTCEALDVVKTLTNDPAIILAVLIHDIGKVDTTTTTEDGRIISHAHATEQEKATRFLDKIGTPDKIKARALMLAACHMDHLNQHTNKSVARLARKLATAGASITDLLTVVEADHSARGHLSKGLPAGALAIAQIAAEIGAKEEAPRALLMGRHCLALGMEQGPEVGRMIADSLVEQIEGRITTTEEAKEWARARLDA